MDLKESQSYPSKHMYELLRNGLLNLVSITLLLLKDLLDGAAEIVFSIHAKIGGAQAGSSATECSERAQKAENDMEVTGPGNDLRFKEPLHIQKPSSVKQTLSVRTNGSEDMHKYCRGCKRLKPTVESSTRNVTKTSGSEEYYNPPCVTQWQNYAKSPRSSENGIYSLSGDDSPYESTSCTSYEGKKNSLSNSGSSSPASCCNDNEAGGYSPQYRDFSVGSTSTKKMRPRRVCAPSGRNIPGKKIGLWKNFKDKFSTILHQHHRHHNHTDGDGDYDYLRGSEYRKAYGKHPSKHSAITSQYLKPCAYGSHALQKIGDAVIHGRGSKKVQKPVSSLIGGLFKHAIRAKRSKLLSRHGKNKMHGKLNWLKLLRRHKKAKKLKIVYRKRK